MAKARKAKAAQGKPDPELARDVEYQAFAQLRDAMPEGAQAGLFGPGGFDRLKKIIKAVAPGVIKGVFVAGMDGTFTPGEIAGIVAETVRRILEARNTSAAPDTDTPDLSSAPA